MLSNLLNSAGKDASLGTASRMTASTASSSFSSPLPFASCFLPLFSEADLTHFKSRYSSFLKDTSRGKQMLTDALRLKREWVAYKNSLNPFTGKSQASEVLNSADVVLEEVDPAIRELVSKADIIPIGLNNHCHQNSDFFKEQFGIKSYFGFTLSSCPCGKYQAFEFHSLNRMAGRFVDFTKDFNDEPYKHFIPLCKNLKPGQRHEILGYGNPHFYQVDYGCKCANVRKNPTDTPLQILQLITEIQTEYGADPPTELDLEKRTTDIWYMSPKKPNIRQVKYKFKLKEKFPRGFEATQFPITEDNMEYYVVYFDADPCGVPNPSAEWIAGACGVGATGNFIVMRKKWVSGAEHLVDMGITPKEFKKKYFGGK